MQANPENLSHTEKIKVYVQRTNPTDANVAPMSEVTQTGTVMQETRCALQRVQEQNQSIITPRTGHQ